MIVIEEMIVMRDRVLVIISGWFQFVDVFRELLTEIFGSLQKSEAEQKNQNRRREIAPFFPSIDTSTVSTVECATIFQTSISLFSSNSHHFRTLHHTRHSSSVQEPRPTNDIASSNGFPI